jgi:hypothetical protein
MGVNNVESLLASRAWLSLKSAKSRAKPAEDSNSAHLNLQNHQKILIRLWILKALGCALSQGPTWKIPTSIASVASELLARFNKVTRDWENRDHLTNLTKVLQELDLPSSGVLLMAVAIKTGKQPKELARKALQQLEMSESTLADLFTHRQNYGATKRYFSSAFNKMVRKIDVTSTSFIERSMGIAENGGRDYLILLRILDCHAPMKIALSHAWGKPPDDLHSTALALSRDSEHPDPHACLELIHLLAITFACSEKMSPRQSYRAVYWLYLFLSKHQAPIKPPLIRAMYHCGIIRYQRAGLHLSSVRYQFILKLVKEVEDPEVVMALKNVPA